MAGRSERGDVAAAAIELGAFIRAHRERLQATRAGARKRRTPGLRREEVAELAGMSLTWYTRLEQGRSTALSAQALSRVASALKLSVAERRYVFELAQKRDPSQRAPTAHSAALCNAVNFLTGPAYVLDRQFTALAWNAPATRLFKGWLDARSTERNLLRYMFLAREARELVGNWEHRAARLVAEFRAHSGPHLEEAPAAALIADLQSCSGEFRKLWRAREVVDRHGGLRVFHRTAKQTLTFEQLTLTPATAPGLLLVLLMPSDPRSSG
jgi:transcriptional regulator with XRE-family HTH domain